MNEDQQKKLGAIERLEEQLAERERQIARLEARLEQLANDKEKGEWIWARHKKVEDQTDLPVPRLELRWTSLDQQEWNWLCTYSLIYGHFDGHLIAVPMGATRVGGGSSVVPMRHGEVELPIRDGAHIRHDAWALKLPAFAIYEKTVTRIV
jgi:hypothetical protein